MKLGELRSAVRTHKGTVLTEASLGGKLVLIPVQKTGFLKDTLEVFGEHKNVETGLMLAVEGDTAVVRSVTGTAAAPAEHITPAAPAATSGDIAADPNVDLTGFNVDVSSTAPAEGPGFVDLLA